MTDTPDGEHGFIAGFLAAMALFGSLVVWLRRGLGSLRNGNGNGKKDDIPNRSTLLDYRMDQLEERLTKLEWLDEFERREKRRLE